MTDPTGTTGDRGGGIHPTPPRCLTSRGPGALLRCIIRKGPPAWGVIDRVVAADELHSAAEQFARRLADAPRAFAVAKELTRAYTTGGIAGADALLTDAAVGLFDTDDARGGIQSFLTSGPGHAVFAGR